MFKKELLLQLHGTNYVVIIYKKSFLGMTTFYVECHEVFVYSPSDAVLGGLIKREKIKSEEGAFAKAYEFFEHYKNNDLHWL